MATSRQKDPKKDQKVPCESSLNVPITYRQITESTAGKTDRRDNNTNSSAINWKTQILSNIRKLNLQQSQQSSTQKQSHRLALQRKQQTHRVDHRQNGPPSDYDSNLNHLEPEYCHNSPKIRQKKAKSFGRFLNPQNNLVQSNTAGQMTQLLMTSNRGDNYRQQVISSVHLSSARNYTPRVVVGISRDELITSQTMNQHTDQQSPSQVLRLSKQSQSQEFLHEFIGLRRSHRPAAATSSFVNCTKCTRIVGSSYNCRQCLAYLNEKRKSTDMLIASSRSRHIGTCNMEDRLIGEIDVRKVSGGRSPCQRRVGNWCTMCNQEHCLKTPRSSNACSYELLKNKSFRRKQRASCPDNYTSLRLQPQTQPELQIVDQDSFVKAEPEPSRVVQASEWHQAPVHQIKPKTTTASVRREHVIPLKASKPQEEIRKKVSKSTSATQTFNEDEKRRVSKREIQVQTSEVKESPVIKRLSRKTIQTQSSPPITKNQAVTTEPAKKTPTNSMPIQTIEIPQTHAEVQTKSETPPKPVQQASVEIQTTPRMSDYEIQLQTLLAKMTHICKLEYAHATSGRVVSTYEYLVARKQHVFDEMDMVLSTVKANKTDQAVAFQLVQAQATQILEMYSVELAKYEVPEKMLGNLKLVTHLLNFELIKIADKMVKPKEVVHQAPLVWDTFRHYEDVTDSPSNLRTLLGDPLSWEDPVPEVVEMFTEDSGRVPSPQLQDDLMMEVVRKQREKPVPVMYARKARPARATPPLVDVSMEKSEPTTEMTLPEPGSEEVRHVKQVQASAHESRLKMADYVFDEGENQEQIMTKFQIKDFLLTPDHKNNRDKILKAMPQASSHSLERPDRSSSDQQALLSPSLRDITHQKGQHDANQIEIYDLAHIKNQVDFISPVQTLRNKPMVKLPEPQKEYHFRDWPQTKKQSSDEKTQDQRQGHFNYYTSGGPQEIITSDIPAGQQINKLTFSPDQFGQSVLKPGGLQLNSTGGKSQESQKSATGGLINVRQLSSPNKNKGSQEFIVDQGSDEDDDIEERGDLSSSENDRNLSYIGDEIDRKEENPLTFISSHILFSHLMDFDKKKNTLSSLNTVGKERLVMRGIKNYVKYQQATSQMHSQMGESRAASRSFMGDNQSYALHASQQFNHKRGLTSSVGRSYSPRDATISPAGFSSGKMNIIRSNQNAKKDKQSTLFNSPLGEHPGMQQIQLLNQRKDLNQRRSPEPTSSRHTSGIIGSPEFPSNLHSVSRLTKQGEEPRTSSGSGLVYDMIDHQDQKLSDVNQYTFLPGQFSQAIPEEQKQVSSFKINRNFSSPPAFEINTGSRTPNAPSQFQSYSQSFVISRSTSAARNPARIKSYENTNGKNGVSPISEEYQVSPSQASPDQRSSVRQPISNIMVQSAFAEPNSNRSGHYSTIGDMQYGRRSANANVASDNEFISVLNDMSRLAELQQLKRDPQPSDIVPILVVKKAQPIPTEIYNELQEQKQQSTDKQTSNLYYSPRGADRLDHNQNIGNNQSIARSSFNQYLVSKKTDSLELEPGHNLLNHPDTIYTNSMKEFRNTHKDQKSTIQQLSIDHSTHDNQAHSFAPRSSAPEGVGSHHGVPNEATFRNSNPMLIGSDLQSYDQMSHQFNQLLVQAPDSTRFSNQKGSIVVSSNAITPKQNLQVVLQTQGDHPEVDVSKKPSFKIQHQRNQSMVRRDKNNNNVAVDPYGASKVMSSSSNREWHAGSFGNGGSIFSVHGLSSRDGSKQLITPTSGKVISILTKNNKQPSSYHGQSRRSNNHQYQSNSLGISDQEECVMSYGREVREQEDFMNQLQEGRRQRRRHESDSQEDEDLNSRVEDDQDLYELSEPNEDLDNQVVHELN